MPLQRLLAIALLPLLACGPEPAQDIAGCGDAACRQQLLFTAFDADPVATVALLGGLEPVEQEALVRALAEQRPDALELSCGAVVSGSPAWGLCSRLRERPHLVRGRRGTPTQEQPQRSAPGPVSRHPPIPTQVAAPARAVVQGCAERFPELPASQDECLFQAAEALASAERWRATDRVVPLCVAAGDYVHGCLHHSIATMLPPLPAADLAAPEDLAETLQAVAALGQAVGADQAAAYESFFWGMWTLHSFRNAQQVDGRLLQVLPPAAVHHVRMAAALRWLQLRGGTLEPDLDLWVDALEAALAEPGSPSPGSRHQATLWKARDFWPDDLIRAGEQDVPAVFCLGPGRRPVSDDPQEDLRLALLEASARLGRPPGQDFYLGVAQGEGSPLVRWTAVRLLGALYPEALGQLDLTDAPTMLRLRAGSPLRER